MSYTRVFESGVFPLLDRLNRTSIAAKLERLFELEYESRSEIRRRQEEKLERLLDKTRLESPFFSEHWKNAPDERRLRSDFPQLDGLPLVTKSDLKAARGMFPEPSFRERVIASRTSGSTGSPMTFYRSAEQESWFWALRFRIWRWAGYRPGDPYLEINLNPRTAWRKRVQDVLFRCTYLTYNSDNQDSARIAALLEKKTIPHVNGFASSLYVLARYLLETGRETGVIGITSTGDTLNPLYRETIEHAFGRRVLDYYGAGGEGVHLASQCLESGPRYHLHPENAVVEILDEEGPAPPSRPGRLVVTQLDNDAMPLIRYQLDDVALAASEEATCPCGRTLPLLERIEGRIPDLVVVPDGGFLVPHFFVVVFKNLQEVDLYQIVQEESERMTVRLVPRPGAQRRKVEEEVRRQVRRATGGALQCEFEWVEEIPLSGAGKRRLVISSVSRRLFQSSEPTPSSREQASGASTD